MLDAFNAKKAISDPLEAEYQRLLQVVQTNQKLKQKAKDAHTKALEANDIAN